MGIALAQQNPFITPLPAATRQSPGPNIAPFAMAPQQGQAVSPITATRPAPVAPSMLQPTEATAPDEGGMPDWLKNIGKAAQSFVGLATGGADPEAGVAGVDQRRAAMVLRATHQNPADAYERLSGSRVDRDFEEMQKVYAEEIPTDLTRQERGMLLMQLGFGIMAGGPGFASALGQAGLQTMGSWQDMLARKQAAGARDKSDKLEILGTRARINAQREDAEADRAAKAAEAAARAAQPVRMGAGDVLLDPTTQQPLYTAPRAPTEAPAMIREMEAMGMDPRNPEDQERFFGMRRAPGSTGAGTALMQNARYLSEVKGIPEAAAADIMLMSAAGRENPEKVKQDIYMTALRETGNPQEAMMITEESMKLLSGEGLPAEAEAPAPAPGLMSKALSAITQTARAMLPQQGAPVVTGPVPQTPSPVGPPAIGTVEDGYRFKGGDPSKPENWEAVN